MASVPQNSRELNGWATGGKFRDMLKGLGNVVVWKHQSKPEQNIKANRNRADALARQNSRQRHLKPSNTNSHGDQFNAAFFHRRCVLTTSRLNLTLNTVISR